MELLPAESMSIQRAAVHLLWLAVPIGCSMDFDAAFSQSAAGDADASAGGAGDAAVGGHGGDGAAKGGAAGSPGDGAAGAGGAGGAGGASGASGAAGQGGAGGQDSGKPPTCLLQKLQSGTATLNAQPSISVNIEAVEPSRAFLMFGIAFADGLPGNSSIAGNIAGPTQLQFTRVTANPNLAVQIAWHVVEFQSCATVQRGSSPLASPVTTVPLTTPAVLSKSFPIASYRTSGTYFSDNDTIRVKLAESALTFSADAVPSNAIAEWQVVTFDEASVQSGDATMAASAIHAEAPLTPVALDRSWLLYSYQVNGLITAPQPPTSVLSITGRFASDQVLQFDRSQAEGIVNVSWYAVTFLNGATVRSGTAHLAAVDLEASVADPSIDPAHTLPSAGGLYHSGGLFSGVLPATGAARVALLPTAPGHMSITRGQNVGTLDVDWFAVQFP